MFCLELSSKSTIFASDSNLMKRVFIDMDNVLVDFQSGLDQVSEEVKAEYAGRLDEIPGLFAKMKPMEGAIEAVHELE